MHAVAQKMPRGSGAGTDPTDSQAKNKQKVAAINEFMKESKIPTQAGYSGENTYEMSKGQVKDEMVRTQSNKLENKIPDFIKDNQAYKQMREFVLDMDKNVVRADKELKNLQKGMVGDDALTKNFKKMEFLTPSAKRLRQAVLVEERVPPMEEVFPIMSQNMHLLYQYARPANMNEMQNLGDLSKARANFLPEIEVSYRHYGYENQVTDSMSVHGPVGSEKDESDPLPFDFEIKSNDKTFYNFKIRPPKFGKEVDKGVWMNNVDYMDAEF